MMTFERVVQVVAAILTIFIFVTGIGSLSTCLDPIEAPASRHQLSEKTGESTNAPHDFFLLSLLKLLALSIIIIVALFFSIPAFIADFIMIFFGETFPALTLMWRFIWNELVVDWFWRPLNITALAGALVTIGLVVFFFYWVSSRL